MQALATENFSPLVINVWNRVALPCPLLRTRSKKLLMFPFFIGARQMAAGIVIGSNDGGAKMALEQNHLICSLTFKCT